jgi:DNA-binding HxlR family transcriptional regulator
MQTYRIVVSSFVGSFGHRSTRSVGLGSDHPVAERARQSTRAREKKRDPPMAGPARWCGRGARDTLRAMSRPTIDDYRQKRDPLREECPVRAALDVIRGRWKPSLLFELHQGTKRYSQLQAAIPGASAQALTTQLRQLEADGIIARAVHAEVPVRVEYSLTQFGATLSDVMERLDAWGVAYLRRHSRRSE